MPEAIVIRNEIPQVGYLGFVRTSFAHATIMMSRRSRLILAAVITLLPVLLPLALAFLSNLRFSPDGQETFVRMMEDLYVSILAPVLALFFATMLVGEDVESQTVAYILTRPVPRSAWIFGRFLAFYVVCSALICVSAALVFAACRPLANFDFTQDKINLLLHYAAVLTLGIMAYGALCLFLGTYTKRPIIYGVLLLFGWQRLAVQIPGLVDFLTIHKYLETVYPDLAVRPEAQSYEQTILGFHKEAIPVDLVDALAVLFIVTLVFAGLSALAARFREYPTAKAIGE